MKDTAMTWKQKGAALRMTTSINNVAAKSFERDLRCAGGPPTPLALHGETILILS